MCKLLREYATSVSGLTQSRPRLSCTNNNLQPPKQSRFHSGRLSDKFSEKEACLCCFKMGTVDLGEAFIHRPVTLRQHLVTFAVGPTSNATPCERFFTTSCVSWKARGTARARLPFGWLGSVNSYFPIPTVRSIWRPFGPSWFTEAGVGWTVACPLVNGSAAEGRVGGCNRGWVMWPFPITLCGAGWTTWPDVVRGDGVIGGWLVA